MLLEQAGLGLCLVSPRGKVLRANAEWLRLTGHLADESLGRDVAELLPGIARSPAPSRIRSAPASDATCRDVRASWAGARSGGRRACRRSRSRTASGDSSRCAMPPPRQRRDQAATPARATGGCSTSSASVFIYTVVRDGAGQVIDWVLADANREALRLLGAPLERVVGRRATELFGAEAVAEHLAASREVMASGRGRSSERRFAWDGRHYLTSIFPLDHWHLVMAGDDTTERVAAAEALRAEDQRKSEFLAMLSHELRNPLAATRTALAVLDRRAPPDPRPPAPAT